MIENKPALGSTVYNMPSSIGFFFLFIFTVKNLWPKDNCVFLLLILLILVRFFFKSPEIWPDFTVIEKDISCDLNYHNLEVDLVVIERKCKLNFLGELFNSILRKKCVHLLIMSNDSDWIIEHQKWPLKYRRLVIKSSIPFGD